MTFPRVGDLRRNVRGPLGVQEIHRAGLTYEAMPSSARMAGMRWEHTPCYSFGPYSL